MNTLASSALSLGEIKDLECLRGFLVTWADVAPEEAEIRALRQVTGADDDHSSPRLSVTRQPVPVPKRPPVSRPIIPSR